jgi:AAA+ ATPase superfamily predicted ATPase
MESGATSFAKMLDRITSPDSPFISEGVELLISESGKEYGIYFSILQLIASGYELQSEIDSISGKNAGAYLVNLKKEYSLIERTKPMFSRPESRKARWNLRDNFVRLWFRFIYPNQSLIEMGKYELLKEVIGKDYEQYSGLVLERYFRDKIAESERVTQVGSCWDRKGLNIRFSLNTIQTDGPACSFYSIPSAPPDRPVLLHSAPLTSRACSLNVDCR